MPRPADQMAKGVKQKERTGNVPEKITIGHSGEPFIVAMKRRFARAPKMQRFTRGAGSSGAPP